MALRLRMLAVALSILLAVLPTLCWAGRENVKGNMPWVEATKWSDSRDEGAGYSITPSGLRYRMLPPRHRKARSHAKIRHGDHVVVMYKLFLSTEIDLEAKAKPAQGKHIYSQDTLGEGFQLTVGGGMVIPGFDEAVLLMKDGDRGRFLLPPKIGYGVSGQSSFGIPPNAELEYFLEVHISGSNEYDL